MITLHLVLTGHWYDEIIAGRKLVEYRQQTPRWKCRIWDKREHIDSVTFARGYTSTKTTRRVLRIDIGPCPYAGWDGEYYRIYFSSAEFNLATMKEESNGNERASRKRTLSREDKGTLPRVEPRS